MLLFLNHYHREDNLQERLDSDYLNDILYEKISISNPLRERELGGEVLTIKA